MREENEQAQGPGPDKPTRGAPRAGEAALNFVVVDTIEVRRWPTGTSAGACAIVTDKIGQRFEAMMVNNGYDAWVEVYKNTPLGATIAAWRVDPKPEPPSGQNKADMPCMCIVKYADGRVFLRVGVTSHWTAETTGRPYIYGVADIPNTGAVYDVGNPTHGDLAMPVPQSAGGGGGAGGGGAVDCPTAEEIAAATVQALIHAFGGTFREVIEAKSKDALKEEGVLRTGSSADEKYSILRHDVEDGAYLGAKNAIYHSIRPEYLYPRAVSNGGDEAIANWLATLPRTSPLPATQPAPPTRKGTGALGAPTMAHEASEQPTLEEEPADTPEEAQEPSQEPEE